MAQVRVLRTPFAQAKGLLFEPRGSDVVLLPHCNDIHTFGMRYPIDVAFLNSGGVVCAVYRNVERGCRLKKKGAAAVIERAAQPQRSWFYVGQFGGVEVAKELEKGKRR